MRAFIVLCLVAVACADQLGYNYHPVDHSYTPGGDHGGNGGFGSGSNPSPSFAGIGSGPSFGGNNAGPSFGGNNAGPSFGGNNAGPSFGGHNAGPSFGGNNAGPGLGGSPGGLGASSNDAPFTAPEVEKEYFTFTADEDDFNDPAASNQVAESLKQGLRVVFIKGPENNALENAALNLAKHAAEQHTAIYVLNKQTDLNDLANKLNQAHNNENNKPEVHFVKYRTPEDAANAQRAIQGEYDALGGPAHSIDGGIAPALNFASQAPIAPAGHHGGTGQPGSSGSFGPQGSYGQQSSYAPQSALAPQGSFGQQGPFGQQGSFGPQGAASGPGGSVAGGPSASYLPASLLRRRFRF